MRSRTPGWSRSTTCAPTSRQSAGCATCASARRCSTWSTPKSESPMETRTRLVLITGGLPRPESQWEICTPAGTFVARADFAYPEHKVAVEYDGAWHWAQRRADDRRRAAMRALGWVVLVYDADDIYGDPDRVVAEVAAALRSRRLAG